MQLRRLLSCTRSRIPCIDLTDPGSATAVAHALAGIGAAYIAHPLLRDSQVAEAFEALDELFDDEAERESLRTSDDNYFGYYQYVGVPALRGGDPRHAPTHTGIDAFLCGLEPADISRARAAYHTTRGTVPRHSTNQWPEGKPAVRERLAGLFRSLAGISASVLASLSSQLFGDAQMLPNAHSFTDSTLEVKRYCAETLRALEDRKNRAAGGAQGAKPRMVQIGSGQRLPVMSSPADNAEKKPRGSAMEVVRPHTDLTSLTLLVQDEPAAYLQIAAGEAGGKDEAEECWLDAPHMAGYNVLLTSGDIMERWTSGRLKSARHRVVLPHTSRAFRRSAVYFCQPNWHVPLDAWERDGPSESEHRVLVGDIMPIS